MLKKFGYLRELLYLYSVEKQTIIAMINKDKVIEQFCIADDFCKFIDAKLAEYTP